MRSGKITKDCSKSERGHEKNEKKSLKIHSFFFVFHVFSRAYDGSVRAHMTLNFASSEVLRSKNKVMAAAEQMRLLRRAERCSLTLASTSSRRRQTDCRRRREATAQATTSQRSPLAFLFTLTVLSCLAFSVGADHIRK